jgi:hypothetical protein
VSSCALIVTHLQACHNGKKTSGFLQQKGKGQWKNRRIHQVSRYRKQSECAQSRQLKE